MNSNDNKSLIVKFSNYYGEIHGRIVYPLTILGILITITTIRILNRKSFRTPTNLILEHIAFFDTIVLISYNIYSFYFYILHDPNPFVGQSKFWPHFAIFHSNIGLTAHSIALWVTCLLAIVRYRVISQTKQMSIKSFNIILLIWLIASIVCLLMIPNYMLWSVVLVPANVYIPEYNLINSSATVYWVSSATGGYLEKISFAILAICLKIGPVCILFIFSLLLIRNLRNANKLRENLRRQCRSLNSQTNLKREIRTTRMLVLITLCTLIVELPQGLLLIAIGIDKQFFQLYSHLGDFWDITSIASSFITFIMYCSMSQQFRLEILQLILPKFLLQKFHSFDKNINAKQQIYSKDMKTQNSRLINQNATFI